MEESMNIPSRIIEGIYNTELKAQDYYSLYGKDNIDKALFEIQKSNVEILNKYSPLQMKEAVLSKMGKSCESKTSRKTLLSKSKTTKSFSQFRIISYAAAAVFIAAIAIPVSLNTIKSKNPVPTERTKGPANAQTVQESNLTLYRQNGREIRTLKNGEFAHKGDVLQLTYQAGNADYGIIFSVDGNGNITRHFPENSWTSGKLKHSNEEIPLDFSYELDDAPDYEYFIMVTSASQFTLENIENKIKDSKNLEYLKKHSFLPKNTQIKSFLIEK